MKLLRQRETKVVFAGKFVKTNTKQKRQSKLRTSFRLFGDSIKYLYRMY